MRFGRDLLVGVLHLLGQLIDLIEPINLFGCQGRDRRGRRERAHGGLARGRRVGRLAAAPADSTTHTTAMASRAALRSMMNRMGSPLQIDRMNGLITQTGMHRRARPPSGPVARSPETTTSPELGLDLLALASASTRRLLPFPCSLTAAFDRPPLRSLRRGAGDDPAVRHADACGRRPAFRTLVECPARLLDDHIDRLQTVTGEPIRASSRLQREACSHTTSSSRASGRPMWRMALSIFLCSSVTALSQASSSAVMVPNYRSIAIDTYSPTLAQARLKACQAAPCPSVVPDCPAR